MAIYTRVPTTVEAFVYQPGKGMEEGFAVREPAHGTHKLFTSFRRAKEEFQIVRGRTLGSFAEEVALRDLGREDCGFAGYLCLTGDQVYEGEVLNLTKAFIQIGDYIIKEPDGSRYIRTRSSFQREYKMKG